MYNSCVSLNIENARYPFYFRSVDMNENPRKMKQKLGHIMLPNWYTPSQQPSQSVGIKQRVMS